MDKCCAVVPTDRKADLKACPTVSGGETEGPSAQRAMEHNDGDNRWPRIPFKTAKTAICHE